MYFLSDNLVPYDTLFQMFLRRFQSNFDIKLENNVQSS